MSQVTEASGEWPAQGQVGLRSGPRQPLTHWAVLSKGGLSLGLSVLFCGGTGYEMQRT